MPEAIPSIDAIPATLTPNTTLSQATSGSSVPGANTSPPSQVYGPEPGNKPTNVDFEKLSKSVDFSEFLPQQKTVEANAATTKQVDNSKAEAQAKADLEVAKKQPVEEAKTLEDKAPETATSTEEPETPEQQKERGTRDYTGLTDHEQRLFRKMGKESFETLLPIYKEHKVLKEENTTLKQQVEQLSNGREVLPQSYYNHPQAFVLSPQFQTERANYEKADFAANHWQTQLENLEAGRPVQDLVVDDKGELQVKAPIDIPKEQTGTVRGKLLAWLTTANQERTSRMETLKQFAGNFQQRVGSIQTMIQQEEKRGLPQYEDPKFEGWKYANEMAAAMPEEVKSTFLFNPFIKLFGLVKLQDMEIQKLRKEQTTKVSVQEDARRAGPNGSAFTAASPAKPAITFDDFLRVKNGE